MKSKLNLATALLLTLLLGGCATGGSQPERKSVDQFYNEAQQLIRVGDLDEAADLIRRMEIRYPFHAITHKLQLELAYAYSHQRQPEKAIAIANRFIAQYPYHERVDYAYYIKALTNFNRGVEALDPALHPDPRKASPALAREAFKNFASLLRRFPDSQYAADAKQRMVHLRNLLAQHEMALARLALEEGDATMAAQRARYVLDHYPNSPAAGTALNLIAKAQQAQQEQRFEVAMAENRPEEQPSTTAGGEAKEAKSEGTATGLAAAAAVTTAPATTIRAPALATTERRPKARRDATATKPNIHGEAWLLAQNPSHYTIQLAGTTREKWLEEFFAEKALGDEAAYYVSTRKGKNWYTALYGSYPSYRAAKEAVEELQAKTGIQGLWIRKYRDIQNHIQQARASR